MRVHVLVPVHNRIDATMECLRCLDAQTYQEKKVVVVDDGSTDQTGRIITSTYPEIDILTGDGNLWWTGAMYMGVEHILTYAKENEFVLSLNNDTAFDPDFIASLVDMSQAYGRAIVGSMEVDYHRRDRIVERGVWIDWNKYRFDVKTGPPENDTEICNERVNVLPGKGTLIPIEVFKKIGNYNKRRFPHYIADYDFTVRAYNAGIKLVVSYKSKIYTRTDLTGCSITNRPLTIKEAYRNYFSIHSDTNIFDHIKFIQSYSPLKYRYAHIAMVFVRALYSLQIVRFLTKPARSAIQVMKDRNR